MNSKSDVSKAVYTPADEPYLGRETVHVFDNAIITCLEANARIAPLTHRIDKTELQRAACQIIPQGISLSLSIRELVRQGYLFGAAVLQRALVERAITILYLYRHPEKLVTWERGWRHGGRPTLAAMLDSIGGDSFPGIGPSITRPLNSLTHGDPESASWNLVDFGPEAARHPVGKILNNEYLCDNVCRDAATWLCVVMSMMCAIFPQTDEVA